MVKQRRPLGFALAQETAGGLMTAMWNVATEREELAQELREENARLTQILRQLAEGQRDASELEISEHGAVRFKPPSAAIVEEPREPAPRSRKRTSK